MVGVEGVEAGAVGDGAGDGHDDGDIGQQTGPSDEQRPQANKGHEDADAAQDGPAGLEVGQPGSHC